MASDIPRVLRTFTETFRPGSLEVFMTTFAPDATYCDPSFPVPVPVATARENWAQLFTGFPDMTCETVALDAISERLWVWQWILRGTQTGSFRGLPPTGRKIALPGCEIIELRGDRVFRDVGYLDRLTMLASLGFTVAPPKPPA